MSDAPTPNPAPPPEPAPAPAAPLPAVKNRGGLALVAGVAVVGLGIYLLQPSGQQAPVPNNRAAPQGMPPALSDPNLLASHTRFRLSPAQVEAIRAARRGSKTHAEMGPDGKPVIVPDLPRQPMPAAAREQVVAAIAGAEASPPGEIGKDEVQAAVRSLLPAMQGCYQQGLKQDASLAGTVTVGFTLHKDPQGGSYAREGEVADSSLKAPLVEACMLEQLNHARFPEIKGKGEVHIRYPFKLAPDQAEEKKP